MKLTVIQRNPDEPITRDTQFKLQYIPPTMEERADPKWAEHFAAMMSAHPFTKAMMDYQTMQGDCLECAAIHAEAMLNPSNLVNVLMLSIKGPCKQHKHTGLEPWGIRVIEPVRPHGPLSKIFNVLLNEAVFIKKHGFSLDDLITIIDNRCFHDLANQELDLSKRHFGGSVKRIGGTFLDQYEVTIHID